MTQNAMQHKTRLIQEAESQHGAGNFTVALRLLSEALALAPGDPGALLDLGACLHELGRYDDALLAYGAALGSDSGFAPVFNNRATTYLKLGRYEDAARDYLHAVKLVPEQPNAYAALATALQALGRLDDAKLCCEKALQLRPDHPEAHWNLSLLLLLEGDYQRGWAEFEWRWKKARFTSWQRVFDRPLWDGSPLHGRTILLHAEQGFGDALQFARYLPLVASLGGVVVVECHRELVSLFSRIEGVQTALPFGAPLPSFDLHAPFMTLPLLFGTTLDSIPGQAPYLFANRVGAATWQKALAEFQGLKVGVVWAGNATQQKDRERSLPFAALAPLWALPADFFSLQLGDAGLAFTQKPSTNMHDLTGRINDFDDTASFIAGLDLVVCSCTAVAHLAGALGKPVFLLLAWAADWRWLLGREDSPWYPTLRIFRQREPGDWSHPVARVAEAIGTLSRSYVAVSRESCAVPQPLPVGSDRPDQIGASRAQVARALDLHALGSLSEAERCLRRAQWLTPGDFLVTKCLGLFLVEGGRFEEAVGLYRAFLRDTPDSSEILVYLGEALQGLGRIDEAGLAITEALGLAPSDADAAYRLGVLLQLKNEPGLALDHLTRADSLAPGNPKTLLNRGIVLQSLGRVREAQAHFERALAIDPEYALARWNLAQIQLLQGDFLGGFTNFEVRFAKPNPVTSKYLGLAVWGGEDLRGKRLVVYAEQAFGDVIQFVRYLPLLSPLGAEVHFDCTFESLMGLAKTVGGVRSVFFGEERAPAADYYVPLLSLPRLLGTNLESVPNKIPYLSAAPDKLQRWKGWIGTPEKARIGLVWAGRKEPDPNRSALLEQFAPLAKVPGVSWYSLQLGEEARQLATPPEGLEIVDLGPQLTNFSETAAAMQSLDLIISVDTATAHLAGALGRPVWTLLPFAPDWRWMLEREDSPWYPSMRLFRQSSRGDWSQQLALIARQLRLLLDPVDKTAALE